jgi:hypothetical protein
VPYNAIVTDSQVVNNRSNQDCLLNPRQGPTVAERPEQHSTADQASPVDCQCPCVTFHVQHFKPFDQMPSASKTLKIVLMVWPRRCSQPASLALQPEAKQGALKLQGSRETQLLWSRQLNGSVCMATHVQQLLDVNCTLQASAALRRHVANPDHLFAVQDRR